jgi:hypothetical protein
MRAKSFPVPTYVVISPFSEGRFHAHRLQPRTRINNGVEEAGPLSLAALIV